MRDHGLSVHQHTKQSVVNRVLHCAETIKGGIASYLRDLIVCQARDFGAHNVVVIIPSTQIDELPVPEGVRILTFEDNAGRATNAARLAMTVLRYCLNEAPDVVHVHSTFAGATVRPTLALAGLSKQVVYCPHGWAWDRQQSVLAKKIIQLVERALTPLCAKVICISEHERQAAIQAGIASPQLELVLNGIAEACPSPSRRVPRWPDGKLRLLFVGRFDHQKGVDIFCEALRRMSDTSHGILAGGSVLDDADSLSLPPNGETMGWVDASQLQALLASAHVLVVPSRWEGFGLIAAEAMRAELPVVAARVGGLPEVVVDGQTGVLFEAGDIDALVAAVTSKSAESWRAMGLAGRRRFEQHFTIERVHKQLCDVYGSTARSPAVVS